MPVSRLEAHYQRTLSEIVNICDRIRSFTVLVYGASDRADSPSFGPQIQEFRRQLETIRRASDAILEAISFERYAIDDRIVDWLSSGQLRLCLEKLQEMEGRFNTMRDGQLRSSTMALSLLTRSVEERIITAMNTFDTHKDIFHFFLTYDVWIRQTLIHRPSAALQIDTVSAMERMNITETAGYNTETDYYTAEDNCSENGCEDGGQGTRHEKSPNRRVMEEVLRWLGALDCKKKHSDTVRLRQEGTCMWFQKTDAYEKWRTSGCQSSSLWLNGKAGCGKSVLVASTIEHLKSTLRDGEVLVFLYCDFRNRQSMSATELMRSLLSQLFCHMLDRSVDPEDLPNKILQQKSEGTLSLDDLNKLCELVWQAARHFDRLPIVVVDALDECNDIQALSHALAELNGDVRLLVTSRPDQTIERHFSSFSSLSVDNLTNLLTKDITLHTRQALDSRRRLRSVDEGLKLEIYGILNEKANCRFRWIQCQLDALDRCGTESEMRNTLNNLPDGLEETYEKILEEIDERKSEGEMARRVLAWLVVALAPLRLAQIVEGLLADTLGQKGNGEVRSLIGRLSSLVSHCEETDILALSHFSVKEYLTCHATLPTYHVVPHVAHAEVAKMCMRHISTLLKQESLRLRITPMKSFPALSYVLSFGFHHLAHVETESVVVFEALESLGSDVRHYPSHWDCLCEFREEDLRWPYPSWPSSRHDFVLYILVAYSSPELLQSFLSSRGFKSRFGTNPLVYAADLRKTGHAIVLLKFGADVDMHGLAIDDTHRVSPLQVSVDRSDDVLVGELLHKGCLMTPELLSRTVCLPWCSVRVLVKLVQTDEFVEWANEIGDEKLFRGIFNNARPVAGDSRKTDEDHVKLSRRLCQLGQDLSADSPFGIELIQRSLHAAHISMLEFLLPRDRPPPSHYLLAASTGDTSETVVVVRFLLRKGADVHAVSAGSGDSALHLAGLCAWEPRSSELTELLVAAGCSPHLRNKRGETPFTIAIKQGYVSVVEALLSRDASLPPDVLHVALRRQHRDLRMIQQLLYRGADVHALTSRGETVLHLTIKGCQELGGVHREMECLTLVKGFVAAGCDLIVCNAENRTALETAIEQGYASVVEHLLLFTAPPKRILQFALRRRSALRVVHALLRSGAGVHYTTPNGDTVLHLSIALYPAEACLDLVKCFIGAACNPATCNSKGKTVLEAAIEHQYDALVNYLLACNVPLPYHIVPFALMRHSTFEVVRSLLSKDANIYSTTPNGDTVLHLAITRYSESDSLALAKILIDTGCSPSARNFNGKTILETAIERRYTSLVSHLLSCDVPLPCHILPFALMQCSTLETVRSLLSKGANINSTAFNGDTVLHLAIAQYSEPDCLALVQILIDTGCSASACNSNSKTVLEVAIGRRYTSLVNYLLSCGVPLPCHILPFALMQRSTLEAVRSLLSEGADVHSTTSNGDTVLHFAIMQYSESDCLALVETLIDAGCSPAAHNSAGRTILEAAIERGYTSVVEYLLPSSLPLASNILPIALQGCSPVSTIELLVEKGADIHATTSNGDTAHHLAITGYFEVYSLELVKIFIRAGCMPTICNSKGKTVMEAAIEHGHSSVVEHLLSCGLLLPPHILPFALWRRSTPEMIRFLVGNGADVHATTANKDTVLHLTTAWYPESLCLELVKSFVGAGCDPAACNSGGDTILGAAIEYGHISVVEYLLSLSVLVPPDILPSALLRRYDPKIIASIVHTYVITSDSQRDALLKLAQDSYSGKAHQKIVEILDAAACRTKITHPDPRDETSVHAAKKPRIE